MNNINLEKELKILQNNFYHQLNSNEITMVSRDKLTFRNKNWLVTFPYNYFEKRGKNIELIRKLAIINSLYVAFFLREDDVIDEYHLPTEQYKLIIIKMLEAHKARNLAIGQLLNLIGNEIFNYIFDYEKRYYTALSFEKNCLDVNINNMFNESNLKLLGDKLLPLAATYTAYCLINNKTQLIPIGERIILNYHIAKQLYDDISDLSEDIIKPDQSYLISAIKNTWNTMEIAENSIKEKIYENDLDLKIKNTMIKYLNIAEDLAKKLNFNIFFNEINQLKNKAENYTR